MRTSSEQTDVLSPTKRALLALKEMQSKLDALERAKTEPIAIIGMGCRFPGGSDNPEAFWRLLRDEVDAIAEVPSDRWDIEAYYDPNPDTPGKMYTRYGGFLEQVDTFEPQFFGISPREAVSLDPQQRLLLEVSWEALENANQVPEQLFCSSTGVFVGICTFDHALRLLGAEEPSRIDAYLGTGSALSVAAGRLSYTLGLTGPSLVVDTACSSSLVAVHLACQSLRNRECDLALAGGVNLLLSPQWSINFSQARMLSPDGHCKTFDAAADGYVRGEGCGVIVLKRLSDAVVNGDNILALIRGSAVNQDGPSGGLTVPSGPSQEKVIRQALASGGVQPAQVSYVEAHGTGTSLGDPIEVGALGSVFGKSRPEDQPLVIGSVKTNIGHLEAAAGIAGLIKVVLQLQHQEIPSHLHFHEPNPHIAWDELPVVVPTKPMPWPSRRVDQACTRERQRLAGISSFGFSGTNAHVILEEAPGSEPIHALVERPVHLLTLSAKTPEALKQLAARYENYLAANPGLAPGDICFTANTGRSHFQHRVSVVAHCTTELSQKLAAFTTGQEALGVQLGKVSGTVQPQVAFLFTGQGSQYLGMGQKLYETQPTFRAALDRCDEILRLYLKKPLLEVLYPEPRMSSPLDRTAYTQPAVFALEYALAQLWQSWGITPNVVMGHSVGEYVAACVAGVFSLEDGLKLISERGRLMQALPQDGEMVSVLADEARVSAAIQPYAHKVAIAALNGPNSIVISGERQAIASVVAALGAEVIKTTKLNVSHAFHSPLIEPVLADFERVAREVAYFQPRLGLISNLTGAMATEEIATPEYWCRHIRQPVRFAASMETLHQQGYEVFVEIGAKPILLGMGRHCLPQEVGVWLPSLRPGQEDWQQMLQSLAELYVRGVSVDWSGFDRDYPRSRLPLPNYPFQRSRYWVETAQKKQLEQKSEGLPLWESVVAVGGQQAQQGPLDLTLHTHLAKLQGLDRLTTAYIISAFQVLGVYGEPGERHSVDTLLAQFNISATYRKLLSRWLERLANAGVLQQQKDVFVSPRPLPQASVDSLLPQVREQSSNAPHLLEFVQRCGENLADVLAGKVNPVDLLFPGGSFETAEGIYQHAPEARYFNDIARAVLESVVKTLPQDRQLRILEVGAGTGGTTASLLPVLPVDRTSYWYTDLSELFLARAKQKFKTYPFVRYGLLDIEQNAQEQGYKYHSFDVVVAANVLHATLNLGETLQHVRSLLAPGGLLLIWEVTHPLSWLDITFGLFEGWQQHDDQLRQDNPLLSIAQWEEALCSYGFEEVVAFPETGSVAEVLEQHILVAQAPATVALGQGDALTVVAERNGATNPSVASLSPLVCEPEPAPSLTRDQLLAAKPEKRQLLLKSHLGEQVARVLGLSPSLLDVEQPFNNLGFDSLMAVELTSWFKNELGVDVSTLKLLEGLSIAQLAQLMLEQLALASLIPAVSPSPNFKDDMEEITL